MLNPPQFYKFYLRIKNAENRQDVENAIKLAFDHSEDLVRIGMLSKKEEINKLCSFTKRQLTDSERDQITTTVRRVRAKRKKDMEMKKEDG